ncbi:MAG: ThiF family adenylyltransferase, partial [Bdellovibrionales bacterium]|nr:ThiF family adenylyltransferase [Bdellovibrionales bacterium]
MSAEFNYSLAFSRNIGWFTEGDQETLRRSKVAIAGMGGVGGNYLLTLARLGVGQFKIADFDQFEIGNFNRQVGATVSHLGRDKAMTMAEMAKDINPEIQIEVFDKGVDPQNLDTFLDGVNLYLDGLDFYCLTIREQVFA